MATTPIINLQGVHKALGGNEILRGVDLVVEKGKTYCIIGRSGTGKSVTLKHIVGLMHADAGQVAVFGHDVSHVSEKVFAEERKKIGYLFQSGALINWMNVLDNVALPLREHERLKEKVVHKRVANMLALVGLSGIEQKMPDELSGGMKKRVGLARALIREPQLVLYDEPTSGLDPVMSSQINELIIDLQQKLQVTSLVVTHDMASAYKIADKIGMLYEGRIIEQGTAEQIQATTNPVVRQFIEGLVSGPITA